MEKNDIIELIKANRLQEALKAIDKATKESDLHNQVIVLSSTYAEYTESNRSATADFQTLEIQRAKIAHSLLSLLDDVSPEELKKVPVPQERVSYVPQTAYVPQTSTAATSTGINNKWYLYAAGVLVLIAIAYVALSNRDQEYDSPDAHTTVPASIVQSHTENTNVGTSNTATKNDIQYIEYPTGSFTKKGSNWTEESDNGTFHFKEIGRDESCITLRDEARKMNIKFDLNNNQVVFNYDGGKIGVLGSITHTE